MGTYYDVYTRFIQYHRHDEYNNINMTLRGTTNTHTYVIYFPIHIMVPW